MCEPHDSTGEPGAGNRHAGFGERGEETCLWASDCGPVRKRRMEPPSPTGYAPPLDSTRDQDQWFSLAEKLVVEDYGEQYHPCGDCGRLAFVDCRCQACFASA